MKIKFSVILLFFAATLMITSSAFAARKLTVADDTGVAADITANQGDTVTVYIKSDVTTDIAGAAFTVTYDTRALSIASNDDISSGFFDTFSSQWPTTLDPTPPTEVTVDGQTYDQPIIYNEYPNEMNGEELVTLGGVMLAGAQCEKGDANTTPLFAITFTINPEADSGEYFLNIQKTTLNNDSAGYATAGETIPMLVGSLPPPTALADAYPPLDDNNITIVKGKITVSPAFTDTDGDGIDDGWENTNFGGLGVADETTDSDHDGYSDLQEFYNSQGYSADIDNDGFPEKTDPVNDPAGNAFDPWVINTEGAAGYNRDTDFWTTVWPTPPDDMMRYGNQLIAVYGNSTSTWDTTNDWKPLGPWAVPLDKAFEVDLWGVDGEIQLAVNWTSLGKIYVHSYTYNWYSPASAPDRLDPFGNSILGSGWGSTVWKYAWPEQPNWNKISIEGAIGEMVQANCDDDAEMEIAMCFHDGLWSYDTVNIWGNTPIKANCPEKMIPSDRGLIGDFGANGLSAYKNGAWATISTNDATQMAAIDYYDGDGVQDDVAVVFNGVAGVWICDNNNSCTKIHDTTPDDILVYDGWRLALDLGTQGLYSCEYDTADQTDVCTLLRKSADPQKMVAVDVDKDNIQELMVAYTEAEGGLLLFDDTFEIFPAEALAFDYGADGDEVDGLLTYDVINDWHPLTTEDPEAMVAADVDNDGKKETVVVIGGQIFVYDDAQTAGGGPTVENIPLENPEAIIAYNQGLAIDSGADGIYSYTEGVLHKMNTPNPVKMETVDFDKNGVDELVAIFDTGALEYYTSSGGWQQIYNVPPDDIKRFGNRIFINWYSQFGGSWLWNPNETFIKVLSANTDLSTAVELDLFYNDDVPELAFNYPGWGAMYVLYYSGGYKWYKLAGNCERIDRFGKLLAVSWNPTNNVYLYGYINNKYAWKNIGDGDADGKMVEVDIDKDGNKELAVGFLNTDGSDMGVFMYDYDTDLWSPNPIKEILPDDMIATDALTY